MADESTTERPEIVRLVGNYILQLPNGGTVRYTLPTPYRGLPNHVLTWRCRGFVCKCHLQMVLEKCFLRLFNIDPIQMFPIENGRYLFALNFDPTQLTDRETNEVLDTNELDVYNHSNTTESGFVENPVGPTRIPNQEDKMLKNILRFGFQF